MKLLAFAASHRPDSTNRKLLNIAASKARALGANVDIAEYSEFDMPLYNDILADNPPAITSIFAERIKDVDGIIISSPEYNWSFPASLKNIIDWTSRIKPSPLANKSALLMCATPSARGGIVGLQQLKTPLECLQMHVFHKAFPLPHAHDALTPEGTLKDTAQAESLENIVTDYIGYTRKFM